MVTAFIIKRIMENKTKKATVSTSRDLETLEVNKTTMAKIFQAFEDGDMDDLNNHIEANCIEHTPDSFMKGTGLQYVKELFASYRNAFPDLKITINDLIAEDDKVVCYTTFTGTNTGKLAGRNPTNRSVIMDQIDICRFRNGKVAEHWGISDSISMLTQLGHIPPMTA